MLKHLMEKRELEGSGLLLYSAAAATSVNPGDSAAVGCRGIAWNTSANVRDSILELGFFLLLLALCMMRWYRR
jgi:hypothetical protein